MAGQGLCRLLVVPPACLPRAGSPPHSLPPALPALQRGLLVNDTIIIRYQIELVVSSGGALSRSTSKPPVPQIHVPPPNLGLDLASLLQVRCGWLGGALRAACGRVCAAGRQALRDWGFARAALNASTAFSAGLSSSSCLPARLPVLSLPVQSGVSADVQFEVEGEQMSAHKIILQV